MREVPDFLKELPRNTLRFRCFLLIFVLKMFQPRALLRGGKPGPEQLKIPNSCSVQSSSSRAWKELKWSWNCNFSSKSGQICVISYRAMGWFEIPPVPWAGTFLWIIRAKASSQGISGNFAGKLLPSALWYLPGACTSSSTSAFKNQPKTQRKILLKKKRF